MEKQKANNEFSLGIKEQPLFLLDISSFLLEIEHNFEHNQFVKIEGIEESGKTIITSEYVRKYNCFSVYFSKRNKSDYSTDYFFQNLIDQISNHLMIKEGIEIYDKNIYSRLINRLRKNKKEVYTFIIDGLEHTKDPKFIDEILDLLNLDVNNFKFLFTDNKVLEKNNTFKNISISNIKCFGFGINEIEKYFLKYNLSTEEIKTIHTITKGIPSRLQIVKDRLDINNKFIELHLNENFDIWIENDFNNILSIQDNKNYNTILALVSLSSENFTIKELSEGVNETPSTIEKLFELLHTYFNIENDTVYFKSNIFKDLLQKKYNFLKEEVRNIEIQINYNQDSIKSKIKLVNLLFEDKSFDNVINIFKNNFLSNSFNNTQKISIVNELIDKVCNSSYTLDKNESLFDFSLQGAILNDIDNSTEEEIKILSLISLSEFEEAIITTDLLISKATKLYFYSKIAKKQKELKISIDEILIDKIDSIFYVLNLEDFGNNLYEIVSDLIIISSKYAMHILNNEDKNDNKSNINELLFTKLSLASLKSKEEEDKTNFSEVLSKLENDKSKEINTALRIFIGNYTFEQLNDEIQNYTDVKERIKLYRYWLENTKEEDNIQFVIKNIIEEIIECNNNDFFNLEVLSDISKFINKIPIIETKIEIATNFEELLNEVEDNGLFINKTFFKLNLFDCYYNHNNEYSIEILNTLIDEIETYPDLLIKCESLMLVIEYTYDKKDYLGSIKTKVFKTFEINYDSLLLETSDHFTPLKRILKSLATTNFELCNKYLDKLNTVFNRDKSRLYIIDQYLENEFKNINIELLLQLSDNFNDEVYKNIVIKLIIERFSEAKELKLAQLNILKGIIDRIDKDLISKTNFIYLKLILLKILIKNNEKAKYLNQYKVAILKDIDLLSDNYKKNEFCQIVSSKISTVDQKFAKELYSKSSEAIYQFNDLRFQLSILLITNFEAIIKIDDQLNQQIIIEKINAIYRLIESIEDNDDKIELLTRLGFACYLNKLDTHARNAYETIFELFNIVKNTQPIYNYINTLIYIYLFNSSYIIKNQIIIPFLVREELYFSISKFYLFKKNPFLVYDYKDVAFNCTYSDISNSILLLDMLKIDINIFLLIENLSKLCNYKDLKLNSLQKNSIISKINTIINQKLPDNLNIQHKGYQIASKIRFHKFDKSFKINDLKNEIDDISNISDKIYVLSILLEEYSSFKNADFTRELLFNEIINGLNQITNNFEFINRVNDLTETMDKYSLNTKWKDLLSSAYNISLKLENKVNSVTYQKRLIDTIYKVDEDLAKELVSKGVQESHETISNIIKNHYEQIQDVKSLTQKTSIDISNIEKINRKNYLKSTFTNLKNINSNLVRAKKVKDLKTSLLIASRIPLEESVIIYEHYFKNLSNATYSKAEQVKVFDLLLENYEAILNSFSVINSISKIQESLNSNNSNSFSFCNNNVIIKEAERNKAMVLFKEWIIEESEDFIYIVDPYFDIKDTELINIIHKCDKNLKVKILCCNFFEKKDFTNEWKSISKEDLEDYEFIFTFFKNNSEKPLHDRYLLSKNSGLRLGTSLKSIGASSKFSEISKMNHSEVNNLLTTSLNDFVKGIKKEVNGEKLSRIRYYID